MPRNKPNQENNANWSEKKCAGTRGQVGERSESCRAGGGGGQTWSRLSLKKRETLGGGSGGLEEGRVAGG